MSSVEDDVLAQKSPYVLHPVSQEFPQCCLWNSSSVWLMMALSLPFKEDHQALATSSGHVSHLHVMQPVSQAPQHFRSSEMQATCLHYLPVFLLSHFASLWHIQGSTFTGISVRSPEFLKVDVENGHICHSGLPTPFFTFCSKLMESVRLTACVVWLTSWGHPVWVTASTANCQAGGRDRIDYNALMDGGHTLLVRSSVSVLLRSLSACFLWSRLLWLLCCSNCPWMCKVGIWRTGWRWCGEILCPVWNPSKWEFWRPQECLVGFTGSNLPLNVCGWRKNDSWSQSSCRHNEESLLLRNHPAC